MNDESRRWIGLIGAAANTLVVGTLFALGWDKLPDPMASHWPFSGGPDGAMPKEILSVGLIAVPWVLAFFALVAKTPRSRSTLLSLSFGSSGLFMALAWSLVSVNSGVEYWRDAPALSSYHLVVVLVATVVPTFVAARVFRTAGEFEIKDAPALELTADQRAVWLGTARNGWWWLLGVLPLVTLPFTSRSSAPLTLVTCLTTVATLALADAFSVVRVTVDRRGVRIKCGHLGLFGRTLALADIAGAEAFDLLPLAYGGWGYRGSLWLMNRAAIVIRRGTALRLVLQSGKEFSVTVDGADVGASLINGIVRAR